MLQSLAVDVQAKVAFGGEAAGSDRIIAKFAKCEYFDMSTTFLQARELKRYGAATDLAKRGG